MNRGIQAALALAAMLGIGGGMDVKHVAAQKEKREPSELTPVNEQIIAASVEEQKRKAQRRQDRWNKSEAGKRK